MKTEIQIDGMAEARQKLMTVQNGWRQEAETELTVAGFPIYYALAEYAPPIPTSDYVRTYAYRAGVTAETKFTDDGVEYLAQQTDKASLYLRGDGKGYEGAPIHVGRWRSLKNIVDTLVPVVILKLMTALDRWINRVMGD